MVAFALVVVSLPVSFHWFRLFLVLISLPLMLLMLQTCLLHDRIVLSGLVIFGVVIHLRCSLSVFLVL
jgi:hypothetical protein